MGGGSGLWIRRRFPGLSSASGSFTGQMLEGGHPSGLLQLAAFLIVIGGAFGAVLVATPFNEIMGAAEARLARQGLRHTPDDESDCRAGDHRAARRRAGLRAKWAEKDPFLKRSLGFLVDGVEASVARTALETRLRSRLKQLAMAKFWENFGGFAPTVGVLGACAGRLHVMENRTTRGAGPGIATAFVATVYGVGFANLVFLPARRS